VASGAAKKQLAREQLVNQKSLNGKTAIVTGGSKGLGLATAIKFASLGANVCILARDEKTLASAAKEIEKAGTGPATAVSCDVSTAAGIQNGYDSAMRAFGRVDIVVNNAGISATAAFETITDEAWQNDLDLKLFAAIRLSRLVWPQMRERRWGRIINVLNIGAKAPAAGGAPTSVSRAAGMALTKILSAEGATHNILVNALLIGLIESDQWRRRAERTGKTVEEVLAELGRNVPLGRVGRPEEFAAAASFLASEDASYITGTAINIDGGKSPVV
jgi:3-oxoacyl-[acyl-carrier protein] reductase